MIFLVAGRTDYCLLVLDAGRLKVSIYTYSYIRSVSKNGHAGVLVSE